MKVKYTKILKNAVVVISTVFILIILQIVITLYFAVFEFFDSPSSSYSHDRDDIHDDYEQYGYSIIWIDTYSVLRFKELLEDNHFTDYQETLDGKLDYNYKKEDYEKLEGLDETYIYDAIKLTTPETVNEMLQALGYADLNDYYKRRGYIDESGQLDSQKKYTEHLNEISKIMYEQAKEKGFRND